MESNISKALD
jgi:hypothetical protein